MSFVPDLQADLGVDRVVGERRRAGERRARRVGVLVVVDLEVAADLLAEMVELAATPTSLPELMPSFSAVASVNGLNAEPGWRWPWVARLNGDVVVVAPADHGADLAGLVVDRHERRRSGRRGCRASG